MAKTKKKYKKHWLTLHVPGGVKASCGKFFASEIYEQVNSRGTGKVTCKSCKRTLQKIGLIFK